MYDVSTHHAAIDLRHVWVSRMLAPAQDLYSWWFKISYVSQRYAPK